MVTQYINAPRFDALEKHVPEVSQDPSQRQRFIGGTDIQHILWLEPYGCARRLWYQKTGTEPDRAFQMSGPIVAGKLMEDGVAEMVKELRPEWKIRRKKASANGHELQRVDRAIVGQERGPGVLEIKTVSDRAYWAWKRDGVPMGYLMQVQWYMHVLCWSWACIAALNRDTGQLDLYEIESRPDLMAAVAEKVDWFMAHHVDQRGRAAESEGRLRLPEGVRDVEPALEPRRQRRPGSHRARDLRQRHRDVRVVLREDASFVEVQAVLGHFHAPRSEREDLVLQFARGYVYRAAAEHRNAAAPCADAHGDDRGVATTHAHLIEGRPERIGADLRKRGVDALPDRRRSRVDGHPARVRGTVLARAPRPALRETRRSRSRPAPA